LATNAMKNTDVKKQNALGLHIVGEKRNKRLELSKLQNKFNWIQEIINYQYSIK